jgi:hypothetical protein
MDESAAGACSHSVRCGPVESYALNHRRSPETFEEMQAYLRAGSLPLSADELAAMDAAGRQSFIRHIFLQRLWLVLGLLVIFVGLNCLRQRYSPLAGELR